jgi:hypothetical protein
VLCGSFRTRSFDACGFCDARTTFHDLAAAAPVTRVLASTAASGTIHHVHQTTFAGMLFKPLVMRAIQLHLEGFSIQFRRGRFYIVTTNWLLKR